MLVIRVTVQGLGFGVYSLGLGVCGFRVGVRIKGFVSQGPEYIGLFVVQDPALAEFRILRSYIPCKLYDKVPQSPCKC